MGKTTWWLRIVGVFYLALFLMNVIGVAVDQNLVRDTIPFEIDEAGLHAFIDAWIVFVLGIGGLGVAALYASTRPQRAEMLVAALVLGELSYGVIGDVWLMARGYSVVSYAVFTVIHLAIAGTGILLLRGEVRHHRATAPTRTAARPEAA